MNSLLFEISSWTGYFDRAAVTWQLILITCALIADVFIRKKLEAKREFFHELTRSTEHQLEIAAKLAEIWDWPKGSIFALGKAASFDDLELRFPLRYVKEIERQLTQTDEGRTEHKETKSKIPRQKTQR